MENNMCISSDLGLHCLLRPVLLKTLDYYSNHTASHKLIEPCREETGFLHMRNRDADQLWGNREAVQRLLFGYTDSTIPLLPTSKISSL